MAEHLASIFGTEKDRVNCPFYFKIGVCWHGDRCSRLHTRPSISPTLLSNMYQQPDMLAPSERQWRSGGGAAVLPPPMRSRFQHWATSGR
ncbi:LOW QUALITY PROTEIN: splicing factor U2af small subunit B [Elaeis guineensis]|uniref:LOW QUALITY PROTEIN: splicing factor U2af small subunit B n=1 Tax=Elaeis guineensis var. tenera TaxID=51953 RepID=UPI003C6D2DE9